MGQIGTVSDETTQYTPAIVPAPFYLNTGSRASADGYVTSVRYCYTAVLRDQASLYQATVGFYERVFNRYIFKYAFNITKQASDIVEGSFQCEDVRIQQTAVQQGYAFGVCSISRGTIGRLNLLAVVDPSGDVIETEGSTGNSLLCNTQGSLPMQILVGSTFYILRLYADIMESGT